MREMKVAIKKQELVSTYVYFRLFVFVHKLQISIKDM